MVILNVMFLWEWSIENRYSLMVAILKNYWYIDIVKYDDFPEAILIYQGHYI